MIKVEENWKLENGLYKCPFCNVSKPKKGISTHIWRNHIDNNKVWGGNINGKQSWNKGLTKQTDIRVKKRSDTHRERVSLGLISTNKGKTINHNSDFLKALSVRQSLRNSGGRSKWYKVKDQSVQGTWERNLALKFEEFGIEWTKLIQNKDVWAYKMNCKLKHYSPDFYLPQYRFYIEIKGFWWGNDREKMKFVLDQNRDKDLRIIEKNDYEKLLRVSSLEELSEGLKNLRYLFDSYLTH